MHLKPPDKEMTLDEKESSATNILENTNFPHLNSTKTASSEKEPRQVYISLRESKLAEARPSGPTFGK